MIQPIFFQKSFFLFGMVHLLPLFDRFSLDEVERRALEDARKLAEAGFHGIMIENFGDTPFYPDKVPLHTVTAMTRIALKIKEELSSFSFQLGINVLRNDVEAAIAIAASVGANFVRANIHSGTMLTDQGLIQGKAHLTARYRDQIHPKLRILADIQVKHAAPLALRPLEEEAEELHLRAKADALIITGSGTGKRADFSNLKRIRQHLPECPLIVGSGVTPEQLREIVSLADAAIVGTWLKFDGQTTAPIDPQRALSLMKTLRELQ